MSDFHGHKAIRASAFSRPIKIAYLIPTEENATTHLILDAIFAHSYSRWSGLYSLIIPVHPDRFSDDGYSHWLRFYDPDVIYSYVNLEHEFVRKIDRLANPIVMLRQSEARDVEHRGWRAYSPELGGFINPVRSLSTLPSPKSEIFYPRTVAPERTKTLLTQRNEEPDERFLSDNFGVHHDLAMTTNPIPGLFETVAYVPQVTPNNFYGTRVVQTVHQALAEVNAGNITPFSTLSRVHSHGIPLVDLNQMRDRFTLFIGQTAIDRLNFWNCRSLKPTWIYIPGAFVLHPRELTNQNLMREIGTYLNNFNFQRSGNSPYAVECKSHSLTLADVQAAATALQGFTHNQILVDNGSFNSLSIPNADAIKSAYFSRTVPKRIRLNEQINEITAAEPEHFQFSPPRFDYLREGQWAVDLEIERHNNLSKYYNVNDVWQLPRKHSAPFAFTKRPAKVAFDGLLSLIPEAPGMNLSGRPRSTARTYDLVLPSDIEFFRRMFCSIQFQGQADLRHFMTSEHLHDLRLSDKGENLRGVISMFDKFTEAYETLTHKLWRDAIRKYGRDTTVKESQLHSLIPNGRDFKNALTNQLQRPYAIATDYINAALRDSLEFLVEREIFHQIHAWRCEYCGHENLKGIDEIKKKNECSICRKPYFAPIDLQWSYRINSFVTNSLADRNGLTVLWALGYLHKNLFRGSFYFLPEVDIYFERDHAIVKREIDILCAIDGKLLAVEAKKSATSLLRAPGKVDGFIEIMKLVRPDTALLVFEDLIDEVTERRKAEASEVAFDPFEMRKLVETDLKAAVIRIRHELQGVVEDVRVILATKVGDFEQFGTEFGVYGDRVNEILDNR